MNHKSNSVLIIDLKFHFKRRIDLRQLLKWALPITIALIKLVIHLYGGPLASLTK
ncbi:MAG: hypothetical protein AB1540_01935 [Bdellovibrionota bacterium]